MTNHFDGVFILNNIKEDLNHDIVTTKASIIEEIETLSRLDETRFPKTKLSDSFGFKEGKIKSINSESDEVFIVDLHLNCALELCELAEKSVKDGCTKDAYSKLNKAIEQFEAAKTFNEATIINQTLAADELSAQLEKYQKGVRGKAAKANEKWNHAKEYFLEEIPKHKTLTAARKAAADRAFIVCEARHLVSRLPDPRKKT